MNILHINSGRRWIGEAAHTYHLVQLLAARGHAVVCAYRRGSDLGARLAAIDFPRLELELGSRFGIAADLRDAFRLSTAVKRERFDIIHAHRSKEHWLAAVAARVFRLRCPLVRTRHVVMPTRENVFNRWLFSRTAKVVCVSKAIETIYRGMKIIDGAKIAQIYSGIDTARFDTTADRERLLETFGIVHPGAIVGIVAQLKPVKGYDDFVDMAKEVLTTHPSTYFLIAGEGARRRDIEARIDRYRIDDRVILAGHRDDVPALLQLFDIAVLASTGSEGFSRATLEYMAAGRPVVGTDAGAVPELIEDGETGSVVPRGAPREMAEKVRLLLDDPDRARQMGTRGRARAESLFTNDRWVDDTLRLYKELLP